MVKSFKYLILVFSVTPHLQHFAASLNSLNTFALKEHVDTNPASKLPPQHNKVTILFILTCLTTPIMFYHVEKQDMLASFYLILSIRLANAHSLSICHIVFWTAPNSYLFPACPSSLMFELFFLFLSYSPGKERVQG